jgi:hypothetical protein
VLGWKDELVNKEKIDKLVQPILEAWIGGNIPLNFTRYDLNLNEVEKIYLKRA